MLIAQRTRDWINLYVYQSLPNRLVNVYIAVDWCDYTKTYRNCRFRTVQVPRIENAVENREAVRSFSIHLRNWTTLLFYSHNKRTRNKTPSPFFYFEADNENDKNKSSKGKQTNELSLILRAYTGYDYCKKHIRLNVLPKLTYATKCSISKV